MEGVPGFGAESGSSYYVDAVYGVGLGLPLGDCDVPQLDYVAGGALEAKRREDAGELVLDGVHLSAEGGKGYSGVEREHFLFSSHFRFSEL